MWLHVEELVCCKRSNPGALKKFRALMNCLIAMIYLIYIDLICRRLIAAGKNLMLGELLGP